MDLWIAATFEPATSATTAADLGAVKQLFMDKFNTKKQQTEVPMKEHGFVCTRNHLRRYVVYGFPPSFEVRPMDIKSAPASSSALASPLGVEE